MAMMTPVVPAVDVALSGLEWSDSSPVDLRVGDCGVWDEVGTLLPASPSPGLRILGLLCRTLYTVP